MEGWLEEVDTDLAKEATPSTCAGADSWCDVHGADWTPGERHCEGVEV